MTQKWLQKNIGSEFTSVTVIPPPQLLSELYTEGLPLQKVSIDQGQKEILGQGQKDGGQVVLESFLLRSPEKNIPLNFC